MLLKVDEKDCFVFSFGCLVCWGCTPQEVGAAREYLQGHLTKPVEPSHIEKDFLSITGNASALPIATKASGTDGRWPTNPFAVAACYLDLPWDVPFPCQAVDRLAIAYSLAQSVRLSYWEQRIDQWVAATRTIPEDMANTGAVGRKHCTIAVTHCFSFFETNIPFHTQRFILWKSCNSSDLWSWSKRNTFHHQMANRMRGWSQTQLQGQTPSQTQMCVSATCPQVGFCWARIVWARWWASCLHWKIRQGFLALAKCNGAQAQWTNAVVACDKGAEVPSSCSFHSRVLFGRILGALEESLLATCCNGVIRWTWSLTP